MLVSLVAQGTEARVQGSRQEEATGKGRWGAGTHSDPSADPRLSDGCSGRKLRPPGSQSHTLDQAASVFKQLPQRSPWPSAC